MTLTLSPSELAAIAECSDVMVRPLEYASIDEWRSDVLRKTAALVGAEVSFFNFRQPLAGVRTSFSGEISGESLDRYEQLSVFDAGFDQVVGRSLTAVSQRALISNTSQTYNEDPSVTGFYLPNHLRDTLGLVVHEPGIRVSASVEFHVERFGTRRYGPRGVAVLSLLLPSFRAGLATVQRLSDSRGQLVAMLDASHAAVRACDESGRCFHQTARVDELLKDDSQRETVLVAMTQLARRVAFESTARSRHPTGLTATCANDVKTASAGYHMEAIRATIPGSAGLVIVVSIERETSLPLTDAQLASRYFLSPREIEVARRIVAGATSREVADAMSISVHTVRRHTEHLYSKLGVSNRGAAAKAVSGG